MDIPSGAAAAIERYLDAVDDAVPGLLIGLHVVGSLALGDYHPERSDIDVVAIVDHQLDPAERSLLSEVHRVVATRVDGPYIPQCDAIYPPDQIGPVAFNVDGRFDFGDCAEVSPINWAILATDAITVRGKPPNEIGVKNDPDAVRAFSAANLGTYWAGWARTIASLIDGTADDDCVEARLLEWGVLGVARVQYAAKTGLVVSKKAGGEHALDACTDEWRDLIQLALTARAGTIHEVSVADLRRGCAFVSSVAEQ